MPTRQRGLSLGLIPPLGRVIEDLSQVNNNKFSISTYMQVKEQTCVRGWFSATWLMIRELIDEVYDDGTSIRLALFPQPRSSMNVSPKETGMSKRSSLGGRLRSIENAKDVHVVNFLEIICSSSSAGLTTETPAFCNMAFNLVNY